jgi:DNA polymerase-3 subunit delta'
LFDWYAMGVQTKQGEIKWMTPEILSHYLWNHTGGYMIIWMADKLNIAASNKLLKLLEEPWKDGFILISENEEDLFKQFVPVARFYISTV